MDTGALHLFSRRTLLATAPFAALALSTRAGFARGVAQSDWSIAPHAAMRVVASGAGGADQEVMAAIAIRLDPGFKTYWRHPGDSGVPPMFDFTGSENLSDLQVQFPLPQRFADGAGGFAIGYLGPQVLLPLSLKRVDPSRPALLRVKADYAVCSNICLPVKGQAELPLPVVGPSIHAADIKAARALVPKMRAMAANTPMTVLGFQEGRQSSTFQVHVRCPSAITFDPVLFVEGEDPWFFEVKDYARTNDSGQGYFTVSVIERSKAADCTGVELTLTMGAGREAIETRGFLEITAIHP